VIDVSGGYSFEVWNAAETRVHFSDTSVSPAVTKFTHLKFLFSLALLGERVGG